MVEIKTKYSKRTLTTMAIDVKLKEQAKRHGINISKVLREALTEKIRKIDSGVNDFVGPTLESNQTPKDLGDSSLVLPLNKDTHRGGYRGPEAD